MKVGRCNFRKRKGGIAPIFGLLGSFASMMMQPSAPSFETPPTPEPPPEPLESADKVDPIRKGVSDKEKEAKYGKKSLIVPRGAQQSNLLIGNNQQSGLGV